MDGQNLESVDEIAPDAGRRPVSFRTSLLRNLTLLILMLTAALLAVSIHASRKAVRTLCQDLVTHSVDRGETELRRFFEPVAANLIAAAEWMELGLLDDEEVQRINTLLVPILRRYPQISSLNTGDSHGRGFMLLKQPGHWLNRRINRERDGREARWNRWDELGDTGEQWTEDLDYDPRERPWFKLAAAPSEQLREDSVHWTEPYTFFTTKSPGITASRRVRDSDDNPTVIAFDILLDDISELSATLDRSPRGFTLITDAAGRLVGLPRDPSLASGEARRAAFLKHPYELEVPLVGEAASQFRRHFGLKKGELFTQQKGLAKANRPFRWKHDGDAWWTAVRPCIIDGGPQLWIAVTVPEDDFLHELKQSRKLYLALAAATLAIAVLISAHLARRFSRPIQSLIRQSERLTTLNTEKRTTEPSDIREIARLHEAQERMRLALDSFARYVPSDVVRELLDKGEAAVIGGHHRPMSIMFTDIAGFTTISESLSPEGLTRHMASYFDEMIAIIQDHRGTVDKLIGDAIVAFWGAPSPDPHHARNAVSTALACEARLAELNRRWGAEGLPQLPTRFGISTGEVVVGNVGSPARLSYTALGDTVNLASRLEGANSFYGTSVLVSSATVDEIGTDDNAEGRFLWRRVDRVAVKGRSKPELVFEPLGTAGAVSDEDARWAKGYEDALDAHLDRRFADALETLSKLAALRPDDLSAQRLANSCRAYAENPPPAGWDGVSRFTRKS